LLEIVCEGINCTLSKAGDLVKDIVAVASCMFAGNIMEVDQKSRPITPVFIYADTRAENEVEWLMVEFDESAVHDRTGCHFHSSYLPAHLRWLNSIQTALFRLVERWLSIGEYIVHKFFGEAPVSYSIAS
jgi:gluconokinase